MLVCIILVFIIFTWWAAAKIHNIISLFYVLAEADIRIVLLLRYKKQFLIECFLVSFCIDSGFASFFPHFD